MLETYTKRKKLNPRNAPYWQKVSVGKFIGFYRTETESGGIWRARLLIDGERHFTKLGGDIRSEFEDMLALANTWFEQALKLQSPEKAKHTIKSVVDDYIGHLEVHKSNDAAYRTRKQLEKHLLPDLGKVELKNVTTNQLNKWRNSLVKLNDDPEVVRKSKDSVNRVLSMAKAAFNMAFNNGMVQSDVEWKRVKPFKLVSANRELFLTDKQVSKLIKTTKGALKPLIQAGVYTGARAGELILALSGDFDASQGTLRISDGKTGSRVVYLSDAAISFLKKATKSKLPNAPLFPDDEGAHWTKIKYSRAFKAACVDAKMPSKTVFYSLRHYHISKALVANIPAQIVAENCGTSIRMLEKHYAKFMKADRQAMMNKVELGI